MFTKRQTSHVRKPPNSTGSQAALKPPDEASRRAVFSSFRYKNKNALREAHFLERTTGIEPASSAWEADVLPMNYVRIFFYTIAVMRKGKQQKSMFLHRTAALMSVLSLNIIETVSLL